MYSRNPVSGRPGGAFAGATGPSSALARRAVRPCAAVPTPVPDVRDGEQGGTAAGCIRETSGSSAVLGGRSLAISTAIQGSGMEAARMARETRPLCQIPYAAAAPRKAGMRHDIRVRYLRTRARCCSS